MTTINTQEDFLRALAENPQWREAVRALILGEEVMRLPAKFDAFVENEFYPFVKRVDHFIEAQLQFNDRTGDNIKRLTDDVGHLKGWATRGKVRDEASLIAHEMGLEFVRIVPRTEMLDLARAVAQGAPLSGELRSFYKADLVIEATDGDDAPCYVMVEASYTANRRDADRARRNAALMTQVTGMPAKAVVGGVRLHESIRQIVESGEIYWFEVDDIRQEED